MPELPEVETVRRSLAPFLTGALIRSVTVREPRLRRTLAGDFATRLTGRTIVRLDRRGKYLHLPLDDGSIWLIHLGMTGQLLVEQTAHPPLPHDHILITLSNEQRLRYNDPRRFGLMLIGAEAEIEAIAGLGVEPLSRMFTGSYLQASIRRTQRTIKDVLMDQRIVAGIGNIYASELLFRAKVRPSRIAATLGDAETHRIVEATKTVLREAIRHRGSSISDYRDGEGKRGGFQNRFRAYDREGQPCPVCQQLIQREIRGGRSSFFCAACQH